MSKLLKLKEWLTLDEAVVHLSKVIDEPVSVADLYRFALDGHVTLSVNFVNYACALQGKWLKTDDIANKSALQMALIQGGFGISPKSPERNEMFVSGDDWISWEDDIEPISGVWDLTMKGGEALEVKDYYHKLTSGLSVTRPYKHGILLQQNDVVCQLYIRFESDKYDVRDIYNAIFPPQEIVVSDTGDLLKRKLCRAPDVQGSDITYHMFFNKIMKHNLMEMYFVPCSRLKEHDFVFVIRTKEITRFIQSLEDTPVSEKPLTSNERNSLLVLIAALCKEAKVDPEQRGIATSLVKMTQLNGAPLSADTIRKILNQIEPAISSKSK
jgi:hypothetical protein